MEKNKTFLMVALTASIVVYSACNSDDTKPTNTNTQDTSATHTATMNEQPYGKIDSTQINQYTLSNAKGMKAKILNYGGTVTNLMTPDKNGQMGDVVLGYESLDGYLQKGNPYFGSLVGRYANRIANAKFTLDGKSYSLAPNDHGNTLHGGLKGFDKVVWKAALGGDSSLTLTYDSKDGEEGFPGNLHAQVIYTVTANNELKIDYTATTDKPTPVNLTNHCYFNLSAGNDSTVLGHELMLNADKYTAANAQLIPTGQNPPVKGTPMDFTKAKKIGTDLAKVKGGYDHNWVLNKKDESLDLAATVYEPVSGRYMEVWTTQPGIQFYTGNFLDGTLKDTKAGKKYVQHGALCLETQHFPDSPNQPSFPNTILKPGETYHQTTLYRFSTK